MLVRMVGSRNPNILLVVLSFDIFLKGNLAISTQNVLSLWLSNSIFKNAAAAKSLQLCPTLCDPIDGSPPDSSVPGILQARIVEWVAIFLLQCMHACCHFSRVWLCANPWTAVHQSPLFMGLSRQEYWSGLPFPSPFKNEWNHFHKSANVYVAECSLQLYLK